MGRLERIAAKGKIDATKEDPHKVTYEFMVDGIYGLSIVATLFGATGLECIDIDTKLTAWMLSTSFRML